MPRFYLHVCDGRGFIQDEVGEEFADLEAAHAEAIKDARRIMGSELQAGRLNLASFIEIEDTNGELMMTVQFADAIEISRDQPKC